MVCVSSESAGNVPTKTRIRAFLLDQGSLSPLFPRKAVIGIGIALTLCGVTMTIFGAMALIVEAVISSLGSGVWIGVVVAISGMTALLSGNHPHNSTILHCNLFVSIFVVACTGFVTIVTLNIVIKGDPFNARGDGEFVAESPVVTINLFLAVISCISGLLSSANFFLTIREACQCYSVPIRVGGSKDPLHHLRVDTLQRKDRIVQWIMQQSTPICQDPLPAIPVPSVMQPVGAGSERPAAFGLTDTLKKKLRLLNSNASTTSTRLSAYDA
jgi:hypothetical protein